VPTIWAKAQNDTHARILTRVGAHRVVRPEQDSGNRVAHSIGGRASDYVEVTNGMAMAMIDAPDWLTGKAIKDTGLSRTHHVIVVGVESSNGEIRPVNRDTVIAAGERCAVAGSIEAVERVLAKYDRA
jgi:trk system potassium uptake protein TrkA